MEKPKNIRDGAEVVEFYKAQKGLMTSLDKQFEDDYARWRLEKIATVGKEEGDYDVVVTNRPRVFADKLVAETATAKLKLSIPIFEKGKGARERISMTERAAYGLLQMADDLNLSKPYGKKVQDALAWHLVHRGIAVVRCWISEEEVGGEMRLYPDVAVWDKLTTEFETGRYGISRICHTRQASVSQIKEEYGIEVFGDMKKNATVYDYFDDHDEVVVIDNRIVAVMVHGRGYVPARVITCGNAPYIESGRFTDTIKDVVESAFSRNRDIWDAESRILSYQSTIVGMAAHTPIVIEFDGKTGAGPPEVAKNPWTQNAQITIDKAKGQAISPLFKPVLPQDAAELHAAILRLESMGSADPILWGRQDQQTTAQGTAMLIHAGMAALKNVKSATEIAMTWVANEVVRQYKEGEFETNQFQAVDRVEKKFSIQVDREKLVTDRRIEAEIDIYTPQDQMQNIGMATTSVKGGLLSKQTARERWLGVEDTDAEQGVIDREAGEEATGVKLRNLQKALLEDGDNLGAAWIQHQLDMITQAMMAQMAGQRSVPQPGGGGNGQEERLPGAAAMPMPPQPGLQLPGEMPTKPETMMGRLGRAFGRRR